MPFISAGICKAVNPFTEPVQLQMNKLFQLMGFSGANYSYSLCRREVKCLHWCEEKMESFTSLCAFIKGNKNPSRKDKVHKFPKHLYKPLPIFFF